MNNAIIADVAAGVLIVGLVFSPLFGNPIMAINAANGPGDTHTCTTSS